MKNSLRFSECSPGIPELFPQSRFKGSKQIENQSCPRRVILSLRGEFIYNDGASYSC